MKSRTLFITLGTVFLAFAPTGQAQSSNDSGINGECISYEVVKVTAIVEAGTVRVCLFFPREVARSSGGGGEFVLTMTVTGPVITALGALTFTFTANEAGCGRLGAQTVDTLNNAAIGFTATMTQDYRMTGPQCKGGVKAQASIASSLTIINVRMGFNVIAKDSVNTIRADLCDADGIANSGYNATTHVCNDPNINIPDVAASITDFTDTLCRPTGNHGHCELDIHGEIGVDILNDATDDSRLTTSTNVSLAGNITGGNGTVAQETPGFDGSLYVLVMLFVLALAHLGEMRRDNQYRIIAGFITMIAGFIVVWELDRLGFNNVLNGYGLGFAMVWIGIHFWIATVLMIPKKWEV